MFDLTIFPLNLDAGREQYQLPGLFVSAAPRKAARMRAQDHLLLFCRFISLPTSENATPAFTLAQQQEILTKLADTYFTFAGSVTAGMRAVTARLNDFLLNRNLRAAHEGQIVAMLNLAVLHGSALIVAHSGYTHTFILTKTSVTHFDDGENVSAASGVNAGRGLGLSRVAIPRFYQAELEPGDLMVVCDSAPLSWNARELANSPQLSFDHLRRRMLNGAGDTLQAAVVRFQPGKGAVSYWKPGEIPSQPVEGRLGRAARMAAATAAAPGAAAPGEAVPPSPSSLPVTPPAPETPPASSPSASTDAPTSEALASTDAPTSDAPATTVAPTSTDAPHATTVAPTPVPLSPRPPVRSSASASIPRSAEPVVQTPLPSAGSSPAAERRTSRPRPQPKAEKPPRLPSVPLTDRLRRFLAPIWKSGHNARVKTGVVFARAGQSLPKRRDAQGQQIPFFNIPKSAMLAIALVIPLVMAAVASTVYFRAGREQQYQLFYLQAQQAAKQASQQTDPTQQKLAWSRVYEMAGKADAYQSTDAARALRTQALSTLDSLDGVVRLDYQPAVSSGFGSNVNITRIIATINDVYLLDSAEGRIFRLYRTATGYDVDAKFVCGGSVTKVGTTQVGPLVDMVALPPNNPNRVSIMGIDAGGNLVLCKVGSEGFDSRSLAAPDAGWGKLTAMTANGDTLYILDPKGNAVYRYDPNTDGDYADQPHLYFDNAIPKMADVIDLAVDDEFLYLLHRDGSMTICESGGFSYANTKCTDPTPYGDARSGYQHAPLTFIGAQFTQIETTQPPDPSLYILDAKNRSIYHFSLRRLNLQRQYLPQPVTDFPLPSGAPTAFTITPNRRALIAFANQLFFAPLP